MRPEGTRSCEFLISLFLISSKLAYLQIITVLVYGTTPPKCYEQNYINCKILENYMKEDSFFEPEILLKLKFFLVILENLGN